MLLFLTFIVCRSLGGWCMYDFTLFCIPLCLAIALTALVLYFLLHLRCCSTNKCVSGLCIMCDAMQVAVEQSILIITLTTPLIIRELNIQDGYDGRTFDINKRRQPETTNQKRASLSWSASRGLPEGGD